MAKKGKRLLSHVFRAAAWFVLGVILMLIGAGMLISRIVTPEWLRSVITTQLEETFHRPVKIDQVNFVLHQGIKVSGLQVRESKDFPGDVFLSSEFLIARYSLPSLLHGSLKLSKVVLMSPRISLVRREDGIWNVVDMLRAPEHKSKTLSLPPLQGADVLSIEGGSLRVQDLLRRASFSFSDFRLMVKNFGVDEPFTLQISFVNHSDIAGHRMRADVDMRARMSLGGLHREDAFLEAERIRAVIDGQSLTVSGNIHNFAQPVLDVRLQAPSVDSAFISRYYPVPAGIQIPPSQWRVRVAAQNGDARVVKSTETAVPMHYHLERLEAAVGSARITVSGVLRPAPRKSRLSLALGPMEIVQAAAFYGPWSNREASGSVSGSAMLAGPLNALKLDKFALNLRSFSIALPRQRIQDADMSISGRDYLRSISMSASRGSYTAYGNTLSNAVADALFENGDMCVRKLDVDWRGSHLRLKGCVKNLAEPKRVTVSALVNKLRVDEFYRAINDIIARRKAELGQSQQSDRPWAQVFKHSIPKSFPDFMGRLRVVQAYSPNFTTQNLELLWNLRRISRGLRSVSGEVRIGFGPGRVSNVPTVREAHRLLNALFIPFVYMHEVNAKAVLSLNTAMPKTLDFRRIRADFSVRRGLADVRFLHVDSGQFVAFADGKVDFPGEKIDMRALMRLPTPRGQLPDRLVDTLDRPSIELNLKDDLNRPTPTLTLRKMQVNDIEDALAKGLKRGTPMPPVDDNLDCGRKP